MLAGVLKLCTSPYHIKANRQFKHFNHTLINMVDTLTAWKKSSWKDMVLTLVHA